MMALISDSQHLPTALNSSSTIPNPPSRTAHKLTQTSMPTQPKPYAFSASKSLTSTPPRPYGKYITGFIRSIDNSCSNSNPSTSPECTIAFLQLYFLTVAESSAKFSIDDPSA